MRIFFLVFYTLFCAIKLSAQPIRSALLYKLFSAKGPIPQVFAPELRNLFSAQVDKVYADNRQYLIKTTDKLFLGVDGTGQLFEIKESQPGTLVAVRIDSTLYAGNNFCAATFSIDSSVFSLGGYGFWKTNGTLKQYNFYSREWDVVPLLEERPSIFCQKPSGVYWKGNLDEARKLEDINTAFAPSFYWVDQENKLFYAGIQHQINQSLSDSVLSLKNQYNASLSVLDLKTKKWTVKGDILNYGWHYTVHLPWGLLVVESPESMYYTDFKTNQLKFCKSERIPEYRKLFRNKVPNLLFYADGHIYFGEIAVNSIDSIAVSINDFEVRNAALFSPLKSKTSDIFSDNITVWVISLAFFSVAIAVSLFFLVKKKRGVSTVNSMFSPSIHTQLPLEDRVGILNEMERQLILYLFNQSLQGKRTSIEEVNKLAGVALKNEPIRRRTRSELINAVNDKWLIISGSRERFILSEKSDFDGRTREYYINEKVLAAALAQQLVKIIKSA